MRYSVAASLDGYIADASGGFDWIPQDPTVDFDALFDRVDTIIMGRRTFDVVRAQGSPPWKAAARVYVVSTTLSPDPVPGFTIVRDDPIELAASLRHESGEGEIWLFGGGQLFATLLRGHQVDAVEVTIVPMLLGGGTPLLATGLERSALSLTKTHVYPSGMVSLHYLVPDAEI